MSNPRSEIYRWCREHTICPWQGGFCDHNGCSELGTTGMVVLCSKHGNPKGFMMKRKVVEVSP